MSDWPPLPTAALERAADAYLKVNIAHPYRAGEGEHIAVREARALFDLEVELTVRERGAYETVHDLAFALALSKRSFQVVTERER